jgi:xanthine dehydrogenase accessory factor
MQGTTSDADPVELFVDVIIPSPTLIIIGGAHISVALAQVAKQIGYRTALIDPRQAFAKEERFANLDVRITAWPQDAFKELSITPSTAVAVLTHDPKIDDPALLIALRSEAFYIGALGSRKTQAARRTRLIEAGLSEREVDRLRGPIGLDIGGSTPEEIALAIMAEIIAVRRGRGGETIAV